MEDRLPYSVQWYEGMLMSPQHFQRADFRLQCLLKRFCSFFSPFCYGVNLLKVDTAAISSSVLRILMATGIFQDGYIFDFDAEIDGDLSINLKDALDKSCEPITVYLGIAKHKTGVNLLEGVTARYESSLECGVVDENLGDKSTDITIRKLKLRLLLQEDLDARFVAFPLIRVEKSETDGLNISNYIPPTLYLGLHSKLLELVRDLIATLRRKISFFSDRQGNTSFILGEEMRQNLKLLIQATLELETMSKIEGLSPFEYYKVLSHTANILASMNVEQNVPTLPVYNHEALFDVFEKLCNFSKKSLEFLKQPFVTMLFSKSDNGIFNIMLDKAWLQKDEIIVSIKRQFAASDNELLDWINGVQIASESSVSIIKDRRVLGAERRVVERGEKVVPPAGAVLLAIKSDSPYIHETEKLYLFNQSENAIVPEEIVLYVDK